MLTFWDCGDGRLALVRNLQMTTSSHNYMELTTGFLWGSQITLPDRIGRPMYLLDEREPIAELVS